MVERLFALHNVLTKLVAEGSSASQRQVLAQPLFGLLNEGLAAEGYHVEHGALVPEGCYLDLVDGQVKAIPGWVAPPAAEPAVVAAASDPEPVAAPAEPADNAPAPKGKKR